MPSALHSIIAELSKLLLHIPQNVYVSPQTLRMAETFVWLRPYARRMLQGGLADDCLTCSCENKNPAQPPVKSWPEASMAAVRGPRGMPGARR